MDKGEEDKQTEVKVRLGCCYSFLRCCGWTLSKEVSKYCHSSSLLIETDSLFEWETKAQIFRVKQSKQSEIQLLYLHPQGTLPRV